MLFTYAQNAVIPSFFLIDPLEQFDVLSILGLGVVAVTNLSLLFALNTMLIGA